MREKNLLVLAIASGSLLGACKWTDFDDLEKESWVESTEKPNSNSNDYGVAMARGSKLSIEGGTLIVLGAGEAHYTELLYQAPGSVTLDSVTEIKLNKQFAIGNLDPQPILITNPDSDEAALITNSGGSGSIAVLAGIHTMVSSQIFGPSNPDAAVYFRAPTVTTYRPLVAEKDAVYGPPIDLPLPSQPKCALVDDAAAPLAIKGIAGAPITKPDSDDIVVWNGDGKLYIFDGGAYHGCPVGDPLSTPISNAVDVGLAPAKNATMMVIGGKFVVLVGHKDVGDDSIAAVYDVTTRVDPLDPLSRLQPTKIGASLLRVGMRSAAILDVTMGTFLVAGFPSESVEGASAGLVLAFPLSTTTGIDPAPAMTLYDAQPKANQTYGRALAVFPYNGKPVLAVSADNEVFMYYQTELYAETRVR